MEISFKAALHPYPRCLTNPNILRKFQERTKDFPNLVMKQSDISFIKEDTFHLLEGNKVKKVLFANFTSCRHLRTTEESTVNALVEIFKKLL